MTIAIVVKTTGTTPVPPKRAARPFPRRARCGHSPSRRAIPSAAACPGGGGLPTNSPLCLEIFCASLFQRYVNILPHALSSCNYLYLAKKKKKDKPPGKAEQLSTRSRSRRRFSAQLGAEALSLGNPTPASPSTSAPAAPAAPGAKRAQREEPRVALGAIPAAGGMGIDTRWVPKALGPRGSCRSPHRVERGNIFTMATSRKQHWCHFPPIPLARRAPGLPVHPINSFICFCTQKKNFTRVYPTFFYDPVCCWISKVIGIRPAVRAKATDCCCGATSSDRKPHKDG